MLANIQSLKMYLNINIIGYKTCTLCQVETTKEKSPLPKHIKLSQ